MAMIMAASINIAGFGWQTVASAPRLTARGAIALDKRADHECRARPPRRLRPLLAHVREAYGLDIGFVLWDGSRVPADYPADALAVRLADEGVIAALIRKPKLDTCARPLGHRPHRSASTARVHRRVRAPAEACAPANSASGSTSGSRSARCVKFLFLPRGGPWPLEDVPQAASRQRAATRTTSSTTTTSPTRSTRSSSIRRWSIPAPTSPTGTTTSRRRSATSWR